MLSSAYKLYGAKGVGALVVRKGYHLEPIMFGGGHQKGMRSGTFNALGIAGLGEACRLRSLEMKDDEVAIAAKRDRLQALLLEKIPNLKPLGCTNCCIRLLHPPCIPKNTTFRGKTCNALMPDLFMVDRYSLEI